MFFSNVRLKEGLCHDVQTTDIITWKITFWSLASRSDIKDYTNLWIVSVASLSDVDLQMP